MSIGLDLGTSRFRALRRDGERLLARQLPTAYTALEGTQAQSRLLSQARIVPTHADDACVILGPEAESVAAALGRPLIPLFPEAQLPAADPLARQVAAALIDGIVGVESRGPCSVVLPRDAASGSMLHDFLMQILKLGQLVPRVITAGQAVGLAELGRDEFTGVILGMGAAGTSLTLLEHGEVQVATDVPCGGDWLDQQLARGQQRFAFDAAGRKYADLAGTAQWKRAPERSLAATDTADDAPLRQGYAEILTALLARFRSAVVREGVNGKRRKPLPLVCHGGGTRVRGFQDFLQRLWQAAEIDLSIAAPRLARDDEWVVARGCLIHAELAAGGMQCRAA